LSQKRKQGEDDEKINLEAQKLFGKENSKYCFDIDQLIFMERFQL